MTNERFKNAVVLILGGTGNIGSAISDAFEKESATVCRHGADKGEWHADLSKDGAMENLVERVVSTYGAIHVLVNATSAPILRAPCEEKTWPDYMRHLDVQLKSAVDGARCIVPIMKTAAGGRIIHILTSYTRGRVPANMSDYITAKYALWGFTKALAKEVGRFGITVNAISPSFIKNEFSSGVPEKFSELLTHETPLGRLAAPTDVARAVLFLASDDGSFITGENLGVTGGSTL